MKITDLMTATVHTCHPEDTLEQAAAEMLKHDVGALPVVAPGNRLVGMITDRDICMCGLIEGRPLRELRVSLAVSTPAHTCEIHDALSEVHSAMRAHQVHRLPVIDEEQRLVGIVGLGDVVRATRSRARGATPQALTQTLAALRQPREPDASLPETSTASKHLEG